MYVRKQKVPKTLVLAILFLTIFHPSLTRYEATNDKYYVRANFIIETTLYKKIVLKENMIREIDAPPAPSGYQLKYMEIISSSGFPQSMIPILYDKKSEVDGRVFSLLSYNGSIKISASISSGNLTIPVMVKAVYVSEKWIPIINKEVEVTVEPPDPPFSLLNLTLKISIDNFAPYRISEVISPDGEKLARPEVQEKYPPQAIGLDLKNVLLNFKYGLKAGTYKVLLKSMEEKMPNAFLVCEETFFNDTIAPQSEKMVSTSQRKDLKQLGYVAIIYSLIPEYMESNKGNVYVNASLIDYVYFENKSINVGSVTYIIPPIGFKFWAKAFVIFGSWFKVKNNLRYPINILYIPIFFKEIGKWTPNGLEVEIDESDIRDYLFVYMVVQLPAYGHIDEIITPNGEVLSMYKDSKLSWGNAKRALSVLDNEAYIQVKFADVSEPGLYTVKIKWDPLYIKTIDSKNRALFNAELRLDDSDSIFFTNQSGWSIIKLYRPGPINITVYYKGKNVQSIQIKTLIKRKIVLKCKVYDLKVIVKTMLNQGLPDAEITLIDTATGRLFDTALTDKNGETIFLQIPQGRYEVKGSYRRISNSISVDIDDNKDIELKLNIVLIIPFLNIPLTLEETVGASLAFTSLLLASRFIRRKKEEEIDY